MIRHIEQIARCDHATPFHVGDHVQWCSRCGALRYRLDRPGGELAKLEWFRASYVAVLDGSLGRSGVSFKAAECLANLRDGGSLCTGVDVSGCVNLFGSNALLELVFRDLVNVDDNGWVSAKDQRDATAKPIDPERKW